MPGPPVLASHPLRRHVRAWGRLLALEREEFIGAVTGHTTSAEAADAAMVTRLQSLGPRLTSL